MTSPALLITLISQTIQSLNSQGQLDVADILLRFVLWRVTVLVLYLTTVLLRGKANYTTTLRVAGFAQTAHILELLAFLPVIGPLARFLAVILSFFGVWMGTAAANDFKGWRSLLLPVVYLVVIITSVVFLAAVIEGTVFTIDTLLQDIGIQP
jgi:hypothetical protein